jgi:hypothetical protein
VIVAVMQVRVVRMSMGQRRMPVPMAVRLAGRVVRPMHVLMMRIVMVEVLVLRCRVRVLVLVTFGQVKPHARRHQRPVRPWRDKLRSGAATNTGETWAGIATAPLAEPCRKARILEIGCGYGQQPSSAGSHP